MHLADGIVENPAWLIGANIVGAAAAVLVTRRVGAEGSRGVAFTGTLAAFVLAAQALNVPLVPGASAHVIGASLLTLAVGPARAVLALVAVLIVQALMFADGGVSALGINVLNIAVIPVLAVHVVHRLLGPKRLALTAVLGTVIGNALGASSLALTLVAGAGVPVVLAFGWLVGLQMLAGLVEGVLTALALRHLVKAAPGLLVACSARARSAHDDRRLGRSSSFAAGRAAVGDPGHRPHLRALARSRTDLPDALERVVERSRQ